MPSDLNALIERLRPLVETIGDPLTVEEQPEGYDIVEIQPNGSPLYVAEAWSRDVADLIAGTSEVLPAVLEHLEAQADVIADLRSGVDALANLPTAEQRRFAILALLDRLERGGDRG